MVLSLRTALLIFVVNFFTDSWTTLAATGDQSQTFTLEGELYNSPTGGAAFLGEADVEVRIITEDKTCVLYAEEQRVNTTATNGVFNIEVGSAFPSAKRVSGLDSGNTMAEVFQNRTAITGTGTACVGGTFTPDPSGGEGRYLQISVTPTSTGVTDVLSPDIYLGSVPSAVTAETLQGMTPAALATYIGGIIGGGGGGGATTSATDTTLNADSDTDGSGSILLQTRNTTRAEVKNNGDFAIDTNTLYVTAATNRVGIGSTAPSFDLSFGGNVDRMLGLERATGGTNVGHDFFVESGGASTGVADKVGGDLYLASGIATGTGSSNVFIQTATPGASGTADRDPTTKVSILGNGRVGIGTTTPASALTVAGDITPDASATRSLGTSALGFFGIFANNHSTTGGSAFTTNAGSFVYQINGTQVAVLDAEGQLGLGVATPTAAIHLPAGTMAAATAPLKFSSPANLLTAPEAGALEYDGSNLFITDSTNTRKMIATATGGSFSAISSIGNATGNITLSPQASTGKVTVDSGTASTGSTNGALVVSGGVGVSGDINSAGAIAATGSVATSGTFIAPLGSAPLPSYTFAADPNTGIFSPGADLIGLATNGIERLRVSSTGIVSDVPLTVPVGTASAPSILFNGSTTGFSYTSSALNFISGGNLRLSLGATGLAGAANKTPYVHLSAAGAAGAPTYSFLGDADTGLYSDADNTLRLSTDGAHRLTVNPTGAVGIGVSSPTGVLHLKAGTATANTAPLKLSVGVNLTTPEAGAIEFDGTNLYYTNNASTPARMTIATTSGGGAYTNVTSVTGTSALTVAAGGTNQNLTLSGTGTGVVTTASATTITNATASTSSTTGALVISGGMGVAGNVTTAGTFVAPLGSAAIPSFTFTGDTNTGLFSGTDVLGFTTNGTEKMRIDASGNVGIGAAPTAKLDVQGGSIRSVASGGTSFANASASVDWSRGNNQSLTAACTATTFTNMLDGATYNLFVKDTTATQCVFTHAGLTFYFAPVNATRLSGLPTLYSFTRIGTDVMVSWTVMNP